MIISHKYKFIYLHLMKTAGTSITRNLLPFLGREDVVLGCLPQFESKIPIENSTLKLTKHSPFDVTKLYVGDEIWNSYYKFSFVRNPFDLLVSLYYWWQKTPAWSEKSSILKKEVISINFKEFIMGDITISANYLTRMLCFTNDTGEFSDDMDFIGRYENLQVDFNKVCEQLKFPEIKLSISNNSKDIQQYNDYRRFYDDEMIEKVNQLFSADLTYFKYNF